MPSFFMQWQILLCKKKIADSFEFSEPTQLLLCIEAPIASSNVSRENFARAPPDETRAPSIIVRKKETIARLARFGKHRQIMFLMHYNAKNGLAPPGMLRVPGGAYAPFLRNTGLDASSIITEARQMSLRTFIRSRTKSTTVKLF